MRFTHSQHASRARPPTASPFSDFPALTGGKMSLRAWYHCSLLLARPPAAFPRSRYAACAQRTADEASSNTWPERQKCINTAVHSHRPKPCSPPCPRSHPLVLPLCTPSKGPRGLTPSYCPRPLDSRAQTADGFFVDMLPFALSSPPCPAPRHSALHLCLLRVPTRRRHVCVYALHR